MCNQMITFACNAEPGDIFLFVKFATISFGSVGVICYRDGIVIIVVGLTSPVVNWSALCFRNP